MRSPTRAIIKPSSVLRSAVKNGLAAVKAAHLNLLAPSVRSSFSDSLDLDEAMKADHPNDPRWDYLLGHRHTSRVIGLEAHSATTGEIAAVIAKRKNADAQLRPHLNPGTVVSKWFWVASGRVDLVPHEKATIRLTNNGITFVGRQLLEKHLGPR